MRTNYVLIDYENVQPKALAGLKGDVPFKVFVFVGASQAKVSFEMAETLQCLGEHAQYIKIAGNGPNALDFHIAFYIGHLANQDAEADFHIISKDVGFDPLIEHLKGQKISARRFAEIGEIPILKPCNATKAELPKSVDKLELVLNNLRLRGASKPRSIKTLSSTIRSLFPRKLEEAELAALLQALKAGGHIQTQGTKVNYKL
ncbi:MAG TPA: PIN domain-containing protein [Dyella sp.]|uniref:PIN domain-containing protein n=1 Tax=Dyella sp. TaxID=1869338 RepID=UPI002F9286C0